VVIINLMSVEVRKFVMSCKNIINTSSESTLDQCGKYMDRIKLYFGHSHIT
jgi:hypothetical protein